MKYPCSIAVLFIFACSACQKEAQTPQTPETICMEREYCTASDQLENLCLEDNCITYLAIWEELFKEENNISDAFFNANIKVTKTSLDTWRNGTTFRVSFILQKDWLKFCAWDKFIINITDDQGLYPAIDLPRNTLLSKDQVKLASDNFVFASRIHTVNVTNDLQHLSRDAALQDLISTSGVNTLCFNSYKLDRQTGNINLIAWAEYVGGDNECVMGTIDLFTGEKEVMDTPCAIIN